jgi:zinc ribbon protein
MLFCPNCGRANKEGTMFCAACGKPLTGPQASSGTPARDSLEASVNRLGIKTRPGVLKAVVVASIAGLAVEYLILPLVGIGALTGYDPLSNELAIGFISFLISFGVAFRMQGARRGPARR